MKIAVATVDGISMSQHFGQSAGFIIYEVEGESANRQEVRTNDRTPHAQGLCNHDGQHEHGEHSHTGIVGLLEDCGVVLCGGMGGGAAQALKAQGIQPVVVPGVTSADEALARYLKEGGNSAGAGFCACKH